MPKSNGGPAFPRPNGYDSSSQEGMSLRDYFAARALENSIHWTTNFTSEGLARKAYEVADAMLKVRDEE